MATSLRAPKGKASGVPDQFASSKSLLHFDLTSGTVWRAHDRAGSICPNRRTLQCRKWPERVPSPHSSHLRFQPVLPYADIHHQRHGQGGGTLHFGAHEGADRIQLRPRDLEYELVVHLQQHPGAEALFP